ncbi:hypothetical protein OU800_05790 [Pseudomonas sp. GOM7]|uniref:hypothetical protein n=1 Tax=unclassified Pseudomonas TaxID=196821 RepID=UPI00227D6350|nr:MULTISPECIES: hypothetical protein [unclassified Pseudomonas]WAJ38739.1 hypothetical protein OU800_05790 [Pseudomonas sp. GOM7]
MQNKFGTIKNPLSVIAIFAGIAEISGAMVLPHIAPNNQELFIWFLMIFPFTLVILFFITLNWNYKVLYAPSDFQNEEHFVNLQKASASEIFLKMENELNDDLLTNNIQELGNDSVNSVDLEKVKEAVVDSEIRLSMGKISTSEERAKHSEILRSINRQRMREGRLLEDILIAKLENEFGETIERDMKFQNDRYRFIFDGVIRKGSNITAIEIKRMNKNTMSSSMVSGLVHRFRAFYESLNEVEKKDFSLVFAIATDENVEEMKDFIDRMLSPLEFKYYTKIYAVDELVKEEVRNVS